MSAYSTNSLPTFNTNSTNSTTSLPILPNNNQPLTISPDPYSIKQSNYTGNNNNNNNNRSMTPPTISRSPISPRRPSIPNSIQSNSSSNNSNLNNNQNNIRSKSPNSSNNTSPLKERVPLLSITTSNNSSSSSPPSSSTTNSTSTTISNNATRSKSPTFNASSSSSSRSMQKGSSSTSNERKMSASSSGNNNIPQVPTTPITPTVSSANPLEDLIRTESLYVQDLGVIIKRVAAAWSRSNFPPPALDGMFRSVEAVYRVNKSLLAKLNEIGPNPASPKALGDLLMRWITEIEPSYNRYSTTYQSDFDHFQPVQSNSLLLPILEGLTWPDTLPQRLLSAGGGAIGGTIVNGGGEIASWPTLDDLFTLPIIRLKYYKKLYAKLLKSTQPGRSDHELLVGANVKLDSLLSKCEIAKSRIVGQDINSSSEKGKGRSSNAGLGEEEIGMGKLKINSERNSAESTGVPESSGSDRLSGTSVPSIGTTLSGTAPRVEDLEKRLCTDRALDIFTMLPKKCKLQMAPANLNFVRQIRRSADVVISFQPLSDVTQREAIIKRAYIFLLTDLFLVCERMTTEERTSLSTVGLTGEIEGPDMWLMYPPLAGKHLRVNDGVYEGELEITVMLKEKLIIKMESIEAAGIWKNAFEEAISFGSNQGPHSLRSPTFPGGNYRNATSSPSQYPNGSPILGDFREELRSPNPYDQVQNLDQIGYGRAPPSRSGSRAFSNGSIIPPPRKQSNGSLLVNDFGGGRSISNSSSSNSLNGNYPLQNDEYGNNFVNNGGQQPDYSYFQSMNGSLPSPGAYQPSFNNQQQQNFANSNGYGLQLNPLPPPPPHSAGLQRTGSSHSSSSGPSPGYSDAPPLPNQQHGGGFRFDQRGPTSRRTDPGSDAGGMLSPGGSNQNSIHRSRSADGGALRQGFQAGHYRLPSQTFLTLDGEHIPNSHFSHSNSAPGSTYAGVGGNGARNHFGDSPPPSPMEKQPDHTSVVAQMRCKAFLQQNHASWKSLGTAKVKLFSSMPSGTKQLVVESDKSDKKVFVSTIVLTDGVERVGKTGVAIELSDRGDRTGIIYMLQMKTEAAALGLFGQLLLGSHRAR